MSTPRQSPETSITFFLDRTHQSHDTLKLLRKLGVSVERHKDHFVHDAPDPEWIPVCAARGWLILSGDKGLENSGINRAAVTESAAKIFLISDHKTRGLDQTAALIAARKKIVTIATQNMGPFYCSIEMTSDDHVGKPRFQQGGGPIALQAIPADAIAVPESSGRKSNETKSLKGISKETGELFS